MQLPGDPGPAARRDTLEGTTGDDRLEIADGPPVAVAAGAGVDTAVYALPRAAVGIGRDGDTVLVDRGGAAPDRLEGVERVEFEGATLLPGAAGPALAEVYRFCVAAYGRPPDEAVEAGLRTAELADAFAASAEFDMALDGADATGEIVGGLYAHVLGRAPDAAGLAFWTEVFDRREYDAGDILRVFAESAEAGKRVEPLLEDGALVL